MKLLHIDSAITGDNSASRKLTQQIVNAWTAKHAGTEVTYLDLVAQAPNHFTMAAMTPRTGQTDGLTAEQVAENAVSEQLVSQFLAADVVVIGAPFYNFSIPTQLKAWIDRIAQPGRTFRYTANGPEGLAKGKTVIIASSRGGSRSSTSTHDPAAVSASASTASGSTRSPSSFTTAPGGQWSNARRSDTLFCVVA